MSATVKPMETVAEFVGGFRLEPPAGSRAGERKAGAAKSGAEARYVPRPVTVIESREDESPMS